LILSRWLKETGINLKFPRPRVGYSGGKKGRRKHVAKRGKEKRGEIKKILMPIRCQAQLRKEWAHSPQKKKEVSRFKERPEKKT